MLHVVLRFQPAEQDFRRQFQEAVKAEEKRYRSQRDEISKMPKAEQRDALKKLKQDRARNVALLSEQFKNTIDDLLDRQNVSGPSYLSCLEMLYNCYLLPLLTYLLVSSIDWKRTYLQQEHYPALCGVFVSGAVV